MIARFSVSLSLTAPPKERNMEVGDEVASPETLKAFAGAGEAACFWIDAVFPFRLSVSGFAGRGWLWWKLPLPIWHQNGVRKEW